MKEKNRNNSLRSLVLIMIVGSLFMFAMAEASYLISSHKINQIATDYYRLVTEKNSVSVSSWYTEQVANLNSPVFALEQRGVENRKAVKHYLVDLLEESKHEYVYDIYFMYPDNVMLCSTDFDNTVEHPDINYNLRPWYVDAIATDKAVVSTAYLDTDTQKTVVTISKRVMVGDEIAGTLCMDMFITSLGDLINGEMMPANRSKTAFLFNMSHDIRTPMNAIVGFTNMAIKNIDDKDKVLESLDKTQKSSELLLALINDILEMSQIESGKKELVLEEGNMDNAFSHIDSIMTELAQAKDIGLEFEVQDIRDKYILVDKTRFNRIFLNLGTNAIKYTQRGGRVRLSASQLEREEGDVR